MPLKLKKSSIAVTSPAGPLRFTENELIARRKSISELGYEIFDLPLYLPSQDLASAGTTCERATALAHALTRRMYDVVWAARGGYGTTALLPFLNNMLPPMLAPKKVVGFSDISFIGNILSFQYPNITYIHGRNFYTQDLFDSGEEEKDILFKLIDNEIPASKSFQSKSFFGCDFNEISGYCVPFNLSLLESFLCVKNAALPKNSILFIEDCNEPLHRIFRKFDNLLNSSEIENVIGVVLGCFTSCTDSMGKPVNLEKIAEEFWNRARIPIISLPIFGHGNEVFPLVSLSEVKFRHQGAEVQVTLNFKKAHEKSVCKIIDSSFSQACCEKQKRLHFTGIGGTGMASVAGLFKSAKYSITGSDTPIFPPMDAVIHNMGVTPKTKYSADNIDELNPQEVVLANVISRKNVALQGNPELDRILEKNIYLLSFPSALRKYFLKFSKNIVVTGTHGKTTTTSLIAQVLDFMGYNPSLFVGGATKNFEAGYRFASKELFILEGDEYDTAFFDKGPKYLHYEPSVALLNNIEFDHADIYPNVEAIENEFSLLVDLVGQRNGIVVANLDDERVKRVALGKNVPVVGFSSQTQNLAIPMWYLQNYKITQSGMEATIKSPWQESFNIRTSIFGRHNAMNIVGAVASIHAYLILKEHEFQQVEQSDILQLGQTPLSKSILGKLLQGITSFEGVKRRFEFMGIEDDIAVFDDFAHHPTAIQTTLEAFRNYTKAANRSGKLIVCFEPRNATMRRSVLEDNLAASLAAADAVLLGKVPQDLRIPEAERMNGPRVVDKVGKHAQYFDENEDLFKYLFSNVKPGDTVVFMGPSGSFSGFPGRFLECLASRKEQKK